MSSNQQPHDRGEITSWSELVESDRPALTTGEVARLLRIDARTVTRAIADGDIPARRIGKQWFVPRLPFIAMFESAA